MSISESIPTNLEPWALKAMREGNYIVMSHNKASQAEKLAAELAPRSIMDAPEGQDLILLHRREPPMVGVRFDKTTDKKSWWFRGYTHCIIQPSIANVPLEGPGGTDGN